MIVINIEVIRPKSSFQLEVSQNSTISNLADLVLEHYNLNKDDFSNVKDHGIKFTHKTKICRSEQTLSECGIKAQSKVFLYIPKQIVSTIETSSKHSEDPSETINSSQKQEKGLSVIELLANEVNPTNNLNNNPINNQINNISDIIINNTTENASNSNNSKQINDQKELFDEEEIHSNIIGLVDQQALETLVSFGFNRLDSAYSLIYKRDIQYCIDLITKEISTDPEYRNIINKLVTGQAHSNDAVLQEIELSKIEAKKKGEDVDIAIATTIGEASVANRISDNSLKLQLKEKYDSVMKSHCDEINAKLVEDMQNGRQIIYYNPETKITRLVDFKLFFDYAANEEQKRRQQIEYYNMGNYQAFPNTMGYQQNPMMNYQTNPMMTMNPQAVNYQLQMTNPQMNYTAVNNDIYQKNIAIHNFNQQFFAELSKISSMTEDNFRNPFEVFYISARELGDQNTIAVFNYGRSLGYNQLKFIHDCYRKRIDVFEVVQFLQAADGDIEKAEQIINPQ